MSTMKPFETTGSWITDGSDGFVVSGDVVTCASDVRGDYFFNAMWKEADGVSSGEHYWKIHFPTLASGAGVGFTSEDHFKQGFACRAINYVGYLDNGHALLADSFGPRPKQGDTIGIHAFFEGDRLKVYIDVNGVSLGLAFNVPTSTFKSIYPMVSFRDSGSATCTKQTEIPTDTRRAPTTYTGIEGDWRLTCLNDNVISLGPPRIPTANIRKIDANTYSWQCKVVNFLRTTLTKVNGTWRVATVFSSSNNVGDAHLIAEEEAIKRLIREAKHIDVNAQGNLFVISDAMSSAWMRYTGPPGPTFVGKPFD